MSEQEPCDLFGTLSREFDQPVGTLKTLLFGKLYAGPKALRDNADRSLLDDCRAELRRMGLVPASPLQKIRFKRRVELLVMGNALAYGVAADEFFSPSEDYLVKSIEVLPPPSSDMAQVVFADGRSAPVLLEDFDVVP